MEEEAAGRRIGQPGPEEQTGENSQDGELDREPEDPGFAGPAACPVRRWPERFAGQIAVSLIVILAVSISPRPWRLAAAMNFTFEPLKALLYQGVIVTP